MHRREPIYLTGKTTPEPKPEVEEEGAEAAAALKRYEEMLASDPVVPLLSEIAKDKSTVGPALSITASYDPTERKKLVPGEDPEAPKVEVVNSYQVVAVKSQRWLGAVTVFQDGHLSNFYCGYGWPQETYFPCAPEPVLADDADPPCHFEPNPEVEPVEQEEVAEETG